MELAVLFCDQVGSTALLNRLGNELADEVRRDVFVVLQQAAELCRGEVIKGSGDGLMVVFPSGPADALRCGELMIKKISRLAVRDLWSDVRFKVGVSHGEAIFDKDDWYGSAINLAARLCAAAAPSQILASAVTVDSAGINSADWVELPRMTFKGFPEQIAVKALDVAADAVAGWPIPVELDVEGALPLVGRRETFAELHLAWTAAVSGRRVQHFIEGPTGVGVSRIIAEFAAQVGDSGVILSAQKGSDRAWVEQLLHSHGATAAAADLAADAGPDAAALAGVCPLIGLRLDASAATIEPEAAEDLLFALLGRIARRAPLLVVIDGLSIDPERWQAMPPRSLVLATGRGRSSGAPAGATTDLPALDAAEVRTLIDTALPSTATWRVDLDRLVLAETDGMARDVVAVIDELHRESAAGDLPPTQAFKAVRRAVPYKGLQVFAGDDEVRFHGRERAVDEVMAALAERSFVAVVGSSGSGKSSVVRAGCIPRLVAADAEILVTTPGDEPLRTLAEVWCHAVGGDPEALHARLLVDSTALARSGPAQRGTVLIIDQLEECFTLCDDAQTREQFLRVITHRVDGLHVLATLRGDFFGRASEHPELAASLRAGTVLMAPPTRAELRQMIEGPALAAHLRLEPGLTNLILTDVTERPGSLPLLSHALRETWRRRHGRLMSIADYVDAGGATGAIARTADTVFDQLTPAERDIAKRIFLRLTALGDGVEDSRRRVPAEILLAGAAEASQRVLHTLTAARLVTADTDARGQDVGELAHEALLREWPRLKAWLDEDREELRTLAHLETAAHDWDSTGRPDSELYTGRRLEAFETVSGDKLNARERTFLEASRALRRTRARAAQRGKRRLQALAFVLVVLLIISTVAGIVAVGQRSSARTKAREAEQQAALATSRELLTQSSSLTSTRPELAMLLAVEAQRLHDSPESRAGLLSAVYGKPNLTRVSQKFGKELVRFSLSPDGKTAATVGKDGTLRLWDFAAQTPRTAPIKGSSAIVSDPAWSTTGTLAVAHEDGTVQLLDRLTGRDIGPPLSVPTGRLFAANLAISRDGSVLAALVSRPVGQSSGEEALYLWHLPDGRLLASRAGLSLILNGAASVAFTPDGRRLVLQTGYASAGAKGASSGPPPDQAEIRFVSSTTAKDVGPAIADHPVGGALAISPDGRSLAVAPLTGAPVIIDTSSGAHRPALQAPSKTLGIAASGIGYSPDGRWLAELLGDGTVNVWRTTDTVALASYSSSHGVALLGLSFAGGGAEIVTANSTDVTTFSLAGSDHARDFDTPQTAALTGFGVDTKRKFVVVADNFRLGIWTYDPVKRVAVVPFSRPITGVAVDPVRGTIATSLSGPGPATIRQPGGGIDLLRTGNAPARFAHIAFSGTPVGVAFSPSGNQLAVVEQGLTQAGRLDVFDLSHTSRPIFSLSVDPAGAGSVRWSGDGRRIIVGGYFDLSSGGASHLSIVDATSRKVVARVQDPSQGGVDSIDVASSDGTILAAFAGDPTEGGHLVLTTPDGKRTAPVLKASSSVLSTAVKPDASLVVAGGFTGLDVWSAPNGKKLISALPFDDLAALSFVDSHRLLMASPLGLRVIDLSPDALKARACAIAGRSLSKQEFADFIGSGPYRRTC